MGNKQRGGCALMLKKLTIEQFVIIDKLSIDFRPGLTVLTGETGAGKSILLDAVGLILGDASSPSSIRQGADQAVLEAIFAPAPGSRIWKFLGQHNLTTPTQKEFIVRRVMRREEEDEIKLNGNDVEIALLRQAGTYLTEIHGQFANQSLLDPSNQLNLLDLAGNFPPELYKNVSDALNDMKRYLKEQQEEDDFYRKNVGQVSKMDELAKRIEETGLLESDYEVIKAEYDRLTTAHETSEAFQDITAHLIASNGAIKSLVAANMALTRQKHLDAEKIQDLQAHLTTALEGARAAQAETLRLSPEYDIDTKPLHAYREKMRAIKAIAEEVKVPVEDLATYCKELMRSIWRIRHSVERAKELEELIQKAENNYRDHAHVLTERRIAAGEILSKEINALLPPLKLMRAEFMVKVDEEIDKKAWTERGFNTITFTARMNPGMPFSPITETASGGELARLVLAVKVVLQTVQAVPTLIFDEVDVGIGGAAASAVGEQIARLSDSTQVMVITHSPQVASRGGQHLHVSKSTDGKVTTSVVRELSEQERQGEISRMLAGDARTSESDAAAKKLIEEGLVAAEARRVKQAS